MALEKEQLLLHQCRGPVPAQPLTGGTSCNHVPRIEDGVGSECLSCLAQGRYTRDASIPSPAPLSVLGESTHSGLRAKLTRTGDGKGPGTVRLVFTVHVPEMGFSGLKSDLVSVTCTLLSWASVLEAPNTSGAAFP